jgi:hypothetical protein
LVIPKWLSRKLEARRPDIESPRRAGIKTEDVPRAERDAFLFVPATPKSPTSDSNMASSFGSDYLKMLSASMPL